MTKEFLVYIFIQLMIFIPGILLVILAKILSMPQTKVVYSLTDEKYAQVFVYRVFKRKPRYFKYVFRKKSDEKWKGDKVSVNFKSRILFFFFGFSLHLIIWAHAYEKIPNIPVCLINALLWIVIAFITVITDPLEAYCHLLRDLKKNDDTVNLPKEGYASSEGIINAFWKAMDDCSVEKIERCFAKEIIIDDEQYEDKQTFVAKVFKTAQQNRESGIIFRNYIPHMSVKFTKKMPALQAYAHFEAEEACLKYGDVYSMKQVGNEENYGFEDSYRIITIKRNKKWYICSFVRFDREKLENMNHDINDTGKV